MARYYFHMFNGSILIDDVGTELQDHASVLTETIRAARDLLTLGSNTEFWAEPWRVWVTDEPKGIGRKVSSIELNASSLS
jgi:hypothetical protein